MTRAFSRFALVWAVWGTACSGGSTTPGNESGALCTPESCASGCCLSNTICAPGQSPSACGSGGIDCVECDTGHICQQGQCVPTGQGCSPANCGTGCCRDNRCLPGDANTACGRHGSPCVDCTANSGLCSATTRTCLTSCVPDCKDKCSGADDGCGGRCQVNDCQGCCNGTQCLPGIADSACGNAGAACANCTATPSSTCERGACAGCTPACQGKCKGAADGCGQSCPQSDCAGCCNGTSCEAGTTDSACGNGGKSCADCTASGSSCSASTCAGCTPDCSGKCPGASDGCSGTCSSNRCAGCCNGSQCLPGQSDTACGNKGQDCAVCPADSQGYSWKCDANQTCVKDTPTGGADCTGKTGGLDVCTESNTTGRCWDGQCCTGCYDGLLGYCFRFVNSDDDTCGTEGEACVDCAAQNQACVGYQCELPAGPCAGKTSLDSCVSLTNEPGVCVAGQCCTSCYYTVSGSPRCAASVTDGRCGQAGSACEACEAFESCTLGRCEVNATANFILRLDRGFIDDTGRQWDTTFGSPPPDPYAGLDWDAPNCSSTGLDACSGTDSNTFEPVWSYDFGTYAASVLQSPFCFYLFDADAFSACLFPYEIIGQCQITITQADLRAGELTITDCPNPDDAVDYVRSIRLEIIYQP